MKTYYLEKLIKRVFGAKFIKYEFHLDQVIVYSKGTFTKNSREISNCSLISTPSSFYAENINKRLYRQIKRYEVLSRRYFFVIKRHNIKLPKINNNHEPNP